MEHAVVTSIAVSTTLSLLPRISVAFPEAKRLLVCLQQAGMRGAWTDMVVHVWMSLMRLGCVAVEIGSTMTTKVVVMLRMGVAAAADAAATAAFRMSMVVTVHPTSVRIVTIRLVMLLVVLVVVAPVVCFTVRGFP